MHRFLVPVLIYVGAAFAGIGLAIVWVSRKASG